MKMITLLSIFHFNHLVLILNFSIEKMCDFSQIVNKSEKIDIKHLIN